MSAAKPLSKDIRPLTAIRMIAATWVVLYHFSHFTGSSDLFDFPLIAGGYLGVDFFFILSGFVLTHVYQAQLIAGRFDYWGFVVKRFARVYPMHLATFFVFLIIGYSTKRGWITIEPWLSNVSWRGQEPATIYRAAVANLTLIHAWGAMTGPQLNIPSWSISAEWFAYLLFPVFFVLRALPPRGEAAKLALITALFVGLAIAFDIVMHGELTRLTWNVGILRIVPEFLIGMSLHRLAERWSAGARGSIAGFFGALAFVVVMLLAGGALPRLAIPLAALAVVGLAGVVFFAADADRHGGLRPLAGRAAVYLGEISYSVYMVHLAVAIVLFNVLLPDFRPTEWPMALLVITLPLIPIVAISALTYRLIEVPGREWIVRHGRRINAGAARQENRVAV